MKKLILLLFFFVSFSGAIAQQFSKMPTYSGAFKNTDTIFVLQNKTLHALTGDSALAWINRHISGGGGSALSHYLIPFGNHLNTDTSSNEFKLVYDNTGAVTLQVGHNITNGSILTGAYSIWSSEGNGKRLVLLLNADSTGSDLGFSFPATNGNFGDIIYSDGAGGTFYHAPPAGGGGGILANNGCSLNGDTVQLGEATSSATPIFSVNRYLNINNKNLTLFTQSNASQLPFSLVNEYHSGLVGSLGFRMAILHNFVPQAAVNFSLDLTGFNITDSLGGITIGGVPATLKDAIDYFSCTGSSADINGDTSITLKSTGGIGSLYVKMDNYTTHSSGDVLTLTNPATGRAQWMASGGSGLDTSVCYFNSSFSQPSVDTIPNSHRSIAVNAQSSTFVPLIFRLPLNPITGQVVEFTQGSGGYPVKILEDAVDTIAILQNNGRTNSLSLRYECGDGWYVNNLYNAIDTLTHDSTLIGQGTVTSPLSVRSDWKDTTITLTPTQINTANSSPVVLITSATGMAIVVDLSKSYLSANTSDGSTYDITDYFLFHDAGLIGINQGDFVQHNNNSIGYFTQILQTAPFPSAAFSAADLTTSEDEAIYFSTDSDSSPGDGTFNIKVHLTFKRETNF